MPLIRRGALGFGLMAFADHLSSGVGVSIPLGPLNGLFGGAGTASPGLGGTADDAPPPPLESYIGRLGSLSGSRVLDVGAGTSGGSEGFLKHGAQEVVVTGLARLDQMDMVPTVRATMSEEELSAPPALGALGADGEATKAVACHPYDLAGANLGTFDLVHCADQLRRATDPAKVTENLREVAGGAVILCECYDPDLDRFQPSDVMEYVGAGRIPRWWRFGQSILCQLLQDAGFKRVTVLASLRDTHAVDPRDRYWSLIRAE